MGNKVFEGYDMEGGREREGGDIKVEDGWNR